MKKTAISIVLIVISIVLAIISYILLPETVITQLSFDSSDSSHMPKLLAVAIPTLFGAGGGIAALASDEGCGKALIVSGVGVVLFLIMLAVNL